MPNVELRALIPNLRGVFRAIGCGCKKVKLNVSASRQHNLKNINMTPEQSVSGFADCVRVSTGIDLAKEMNISRHLSNTLGRTMTESYVLRAGRSCDLIVI